MSQLYPDEDLLPSMDLFPGEVTSTFAVEAVEALQPWMTEDLERWLDAAGGFFDPVLDIAGETGTDGEDGYLPGYGALFDPDECPEEWLAYLAQYVGVRVPVGAPAEEARAIVKAESGKERGTLAAVEAAVKRSLTGKQLFAVVERRSATNTDDAYHFLILVYNSEELPSESVLKANVNGVKPGGVFYTVIVGDLTYAVLEAAKSLYSELESAHVTYADMESDPSK